MTSATFSDELPDGADLGPADPKLHGKADRRTVLEPADARADRRDTRVRRTSLRAAASCSRSLTLFAVTTNCAKFGAESC